MFDYRENFESNNPSVSIMYHDEYVNDENGNAKMKIIKVADSFDDFLNFLNLTFIGIMYVFADFREKNFFTYLLYLCSYQYPLYQWYA